MAKNKEQNIKIGNVVRDYSSRLFGFIRNRVPTNADAEDILQEVWYQFSNVVDTDSIEQVSGWLYRVARNRITDNFRKKKPELIDDFAYEDADGETQYKDILLADFDSSDDAELKELFWQELLSALDELPQNQRDVFIWNELEDQTFQEISDRTGVNIKTLISRKGYAVKFLRTRLQGLYDEFIEQ